MEESVKIADNYVLWKPKGKLELDVLEQALSSIETIMKNHNAPLHLLVDINELTNISMSSRKYGLDWLKRDFFSSAIVFGGSTFITFMVNKIILLSGLGDRFVIVKRFEEALERIKE